MKDIEKDSGKKRLSEIARRKIETTMIGSLASIEKHFGFLWGHGEYTLTKEQERMKETYEVLRAEILDKGNAQIRHIESDINNFDIKTNRFYYNIPIRKLGNDRD